MLRKGNRTIIIKFIMKDIARRVHTYDSRQCKSRRFVSTERAISSRYIYSVQGQNEFEGAFIATNERLIMNVDMNGQFYYRNIRYDEVNQVDYDGKDII